MNADQAFDAEVETQTITKASTSLNQCDIIEDAAASPYSTSDQNEPLLAASRSKSYTLYTASNPPNEQAPKAGAHTWDGLQDFHGLPWSRTPSVWWLLPPFTLLALAFGGTIVPKIQLTLSLVCAEHLREKAAADPNFHFTPVIKGEANPQCRTAEIQALVTRFTLFLGLLSGLLSAIISPKLGVLSDRRGRLPALAITTLGMLMSEIVFILVASSETIPVNVLFVGAFFEGIGGSFIAAMAISYAYAADCTAPKRRNVIFGYYHGCLFGGIALGPLFAAYIIRATGYIISIFYIAAACQVAFAIFILLIIPESISQKRRLNNREEASLIRLGQESKSRFTKLKKAAQITNFLAPLAILWPKDSWSGPKIRRNLFFLAAVDTTMFGIAMGAMNIILLYSGYAFGWSTFETSVLVTVVNSCRVLVLLLVLPALSWLFQSRRRKREGEQARHGHGCDNVDLMIIRAAIFFDTLGYIGYALAPTGFLFILCGAVTSLGGMGSPTLQSALTKHVPPERTGQVLGAMGLLHSSARVVAPLIFNLIYASTVGSLPQAVFMSLAATFGIAFVFSWFIRPYVSWDSSLDNGISQSD